MLQKGKTWIYGKRQLLGEIANKESTFDKMDTRYERLIWERSICQDKNDHLSQDLSQSKSINSLGKTFVVVI